MAEMAKEAAAQQALLRAWECLFNEGFQVTEFKRDQTDDLLANLRRTEAIWKAAYAEGLKDGRAQAFNEAIALVDKQLTPKKQAG
jgi:hypothetical protein